MERQKQTHPFPPLYNSSSRILILGSFPSVKSRMQMFFYGHRQNRFWNVMAAVLGEAVPVTVEEKKHMILSNNIALWDVIGSCTIEGSADSSIKNVVPNDISVILDNAPIAYIFTNGATAKKYYDKYTAPVCGRPAGVLPSTSPANAAWSTDDLISAWNVIRECK